MGKTDAIEVVKYIKFPDRRLISGFLTVNVVSHNDNDSLDDASDEYFTGFGGGEHFETTYPFNGNAPNDPNRTGLKHSFGDYDCLLFWVAGGMTLHAPSFSTRMSQSDLESGGFLDNASGPASWEDGAGSPSAAYDSNENWFLSSNVVHPCQHFLKSHLIARTNNGYGHIANTSTTNAYYKIPAIKTHQFEYDDNNSTTDNVQGDSTNSTPGSRKGNNYRYVVSNGTFSNDDDGDFVEDLSDASKNTYFPMIENVEVYGKHNYTIPSHKNGPSGTNYIYSNTNTTVGNYAHEANFWSMVIKIKFRGYNPSAATGQATHEFFKSRTNVMFQPFGETASSDIGNSLHTS